MLTGARALRLCTRRGLPRSPQMVLAAARSTPLPQVPALPAAAAAGLIAAGREPAGRRGSGSAGVGACGSSSSVAPTSSAGTSRRRRSSAATTSPRSPAASPVTPPEGARALHGDRDDPDGAAGGARRLGARARRRHLVPDPGRGPQRRRRAGRRARLRLRQQPQRLRATGRPGPLGPEDDEPTWTTEDDDYGPIKAFAERELGAAVGERFLTARAGLIVGPYDPIHRLGWWLDRIARGGRVVVPDALDQPIAAVDARDLGRLAGRDGRAGPRRRGQRHRTRRDDHAGRAARPLPRGHRQRRGVGAGAGGGAAGRGRRAVGAPAAVAARPTPPGRPGTSTRPAPASSACRAARWPSRWPTPGPGSGRTSDPPVPANRPAPGLPPELEAQLLAAH